MLPECVDVPGRRGVDEFVFVAMILVHILDHSIKVSVVPRSGLILEVRAEENKDIISQVVSYTIV